MSIKSIKEFEYFAPETVDEALSLLAKYGSDAKLVSGGTDLVPKMKSQGEKPKVLISIKGIKELDYVKYDEETGLSFGAAASIKAVEDCQFVKDLYPALYEGAHAIASTQIRNMGTLVGNICNAVPSADSAPGMLVLDAVVHIIGPKGRRDVAIADFFVGVCKTVVQPDELVTGVTIPTPATNNKSWYIPFTVRRALDLAIVGVAANITMVGNVCQDVKIALGAVAIIPKRAYNAEEVLRGKELTDELILEAAKVASEEDCAPITDLRATAEYRKELVRVLTKDAVKACI